MMMSCQVSDYLKTGPQAAQMITIDVAPMNTWELPVKLDAQLANFSKRFLFFILLLKFD